MSGGLKPFYVRQSPEISNFLERGVWTAACMAEAVRLGATVARITEHATNPNICLFEAWEGVELGPSDLAPSVLAPAHWPH